MDNGKSRQLTSHTIFVILPVLLPGLWATCDIWNFTDTETRHTFQVGQKCVRLSKEQRSWEESKELCAKYGGQLLKLSTAEEYSMIKSSLPEKHFTCAWIGLTDSHQEGDWRWVDGSSLVFEDWSLRTLGELVKFVLDCGAVCWRTRFPLNLIWHQEICSFSWQFLCEYEVSPDFTSLKTRPTTSAPRTDYREDKFSEALPDFTSLKTRPTTSAPRKDYREDKFSVVQKIENYRSRRLMSRPTLTARVFMASMSSLQLPSHQGPLCMLFFCSRSG